MKLGFVSACLPYLPCADGFRIYGSNLIRCLSRQHEIHLVCLLRPDDTEYLGWANRFCASITSISWKRSRAPMRCANLVSSFLCGKQLHSRKTVQAGLWHSFRQNKWDILHVEGPFMAGLLPNDMPIPRVLSVHDSWTLRCREILDCSQDLSEKAYYSMLAFLEPRYERLAYSQYNRCLVVADRDKVALERTLGTSGKVFTLPHGTDLEYFTPATVEKQEQTLVFHGNLGYSPNVEAAVELARSILPGIRRAVPKAALRLVGARPAPAVEALGSPDQVTIMANLPDLRHAVRSAEVYACPVRHGSGLKNKILEAMAMQMPVVAYAPAVQGIDCIHGKHLLIADSQESFIRSVVQLFQDREHAERLGRAARLLMESQYSCEARARTYEVLCTEVQTEWQQSHSAGLRKTDKAVDGSMNAYSL